jgi:hypothetical protein
MLNAEVLTFREFVMHEPLPLSTIQAAILEFIQDRADVVLFGAQAVNAYVDEPRATQDVDLLSNRAAEFAEELRRHISDAFHIAVRAREISGKGWRIYQTRKEGNRHLADIRIQRELPASVAIERVNVLTPVELIVSKVLTYASRRGKPKAGTDWRDLAMLLLRFPELKAADGEVSRILAERDVGESAMCFWHELVEQDFTVEDDDDLAF